MLIDVRKSVGGFVFNSLVKPPDRENSSLVFHGGDYGHGYLYEEIFCRDESDITAAANLIPKREGAILDLAGGAGRFSKQVVEMGREVALVDKSVTMLEIARRRKKELGPKLSPLLKIYPQDISQLQLGREFICAFSINNGLEHLCDEYAIGQALKRVRDHLHPEGSFYVDVHYPNYWDRTPHWKAGNWEYTQDFVHNGKRYRVWARTKAGKKENEVIWEHAVTQNLFHYTFLKTQIMILPLQKWHHLLSEAGFKVKAIWGDWQGNKLDTSLPKMIFSLTK